MDDAAVLAPKDVAPLRRSGQLGPAPASVLDGDSVRGRAVADALPHGFLLVGRLGTPKARSSAGRAAWGDAAVAYEAVWCAGAA